ncbi:NADH-quinone oxidoreductase subunit J [Rhodovarius crocodyli]|uniref:NADH-quinone oxidoreductase subunit J n=1 Tax=Rhodovarius crocodyli TaxID=1979269 RepID=A0A437MCR9_9PROT|nr:NADH-quinone oxidoreductase subunit J [Rhodovarius crocodyli]RVT95418.1 NADH-quinone oxidoreductase subunit J [Rhodovarius crocodyli]
MIAGLAFYLFAAILIACATMVVTSRNPVHSVLYLILGFFNAAGLFLLAGAEFLAMILVIVYVGAVAVLFLFVVMMLDIDFAKMREGFQRYAPFGAVVGGILFLELLMVMGTWQFSGDAAELRLSPVPGGVSNTVALGRVLYTDYVFLFQIAGLILLVAMMGAIVLTLRERPGTRRQVIEDQLAREGKVEILSVPSGKGIRELGIYRPLPKPEPAPKQVSHGHGHGHDDHGHGGHH